MLLRNQGVMSVVSPVFGIYLPKIAVDLVIKGASTTEVYIVK